MEIHNQSASKLNYKYKNSLNKNHTSRVGEKRTETRGLTSDIPTYNTAHFTTLLYFEHMLLYFNNDC